MMFSPTKMDKHCTDAKKNPCLTRVHQISLTFRKHLFCIYWHGIFLHPCRTMTWCSLDPISISVDVSNSEQVREESEKLQNPTPQQKINKQPS